MAVETDVPSPDAGAGDNAAANPTAEPVPSEVAKVHKSGGDDAPAPETAAAGEPPSKRREAEPPDVPEAYLHFNGRIIEVEASDESAGTAFEELFGRARFEAAFPDAKNLPMPIGLDLEWKPDLKKWKAGSDNPVALVQLACWDAVLLVHVRVPPREGATVDMPLWLAECLQSPDKVKVTGSFDVSDKAKLRRTFGWDFDARVSQPSCFVDVAELADERGLPRGLKKLASSCGLQMQKQKQVGCSNWAAEGELSSAQRQYAAEDDIATNKKALAEATEIREKQAAEFHKSELDDIEALENLKAAIEVLSRHHSSAFPQLALSFLVHGQKDIPWGPEHESRAERAFDDMMRSKGMHDDAADVRPHVAAPHHFLQADEAKAAAPAAQSSGWSAHEMVLVRRALQTASAFVQRRHGYMPSYTSQSGEIMGVLKELQEEMKASLSDAQKAEAAAAATFAELRAAKTEEIENMEKSAERKEDELATTNNAVANAKEELTQTEASLSEDQKFLMNLKETCKDATSNFEERKSARLTEIKAVTETISILTADGARDTFKATYSFAQLSSERQEKIQDQRKHAAEVLRRAAAKAHSPELSIMATNVQLDAFTKVKAAIDKMVAQLKQQQADEVATNDYCKAEIQKNEMDTATATSEKESHEQKIASLASDIAKLTDDITKAKSEIASLQLSLQRATEDRVKESMEFQKTIADQRETVGILKQALERLAEFYDKEDLMQVGSHGLQAHKQTPPVVQKEYAANTGSTGVMNMIEKLIYDAKALEKDTTKAEQEAQDAYEALVESTNGSVAALMKEVVSLTSTMAETKDDKLAAEGDLKSTNAELDGLAKYNADLHGECDYVLKNFGARQAARQQEIEALQQAKAILSGA